MSVEVMSGVVEPFEGCAKVNVDRSVEPKHGKSGIGGSLPGLQVIGPRPERVYSHTLLLELKNHPLALQWPPYLDEAFKNSRGVWDPDRWHLDRKRGETPDMMERLPPRGRGGEQRLIDLDRGGIDEDLGPLVLSPQRRSFISGCAAAEAEVSLRPEVPGKRVGSGRLLAREPEGPGDGRMAFRRGEELRRGPGGRIEDGGRFGFRGREDDRDGGWGDDRRGRGRTEQGFHEDRRATEDRRNEKDRDKDVRGGRGDRNRSRRQNEPEWMNECVSKSDFIELRGFDQGPGGSKQKDPDDTESNNSSNGDSGGGKALNIGNLLPGLSTNKSKETALNIGNILPGLGKGTGSSSGFPSGGISVEDLEREQREKRNNNYPKERKHKTNNNNNSEELLVEPKQESSQDGIEVEQLEGFNYDQIIESINLNSILGGGTGSVPQEVAYQPKQSGPQGSRFSQFFARPQGGNLVDGSRRGSIPEELGLGNSKENNVDGPPSIRIPSPNQEERYFAPISPAAQTRTMTNSILDMINKGGPQQQGVPQHPPRAVHELEEGIRRHLGLGGVLPSPAGQPTGMPPTYGMRNIPPYQQNKECPGQEQHQETMSAFKKLVAQMGNQAGSQREQAVPFGPGVVRPSPISAGLPQNAPTEQEILEHMMSGGGPRAPPKAPHKMPTLPPALTAYLANHPLNTELLARPEAEQLIVGLNSGTITMENILQQLGNPGLQQRQRDLLLSVLKIRTHGASGRTGPPNLPPQLSRLSPVPSDPLMLLPQGNTAPSRVSPLMFAAGPPAGGHLSVSPVPQAARVPSPQEMTVLTQQIMQQALIKRKLEEQKENFRRRQGEDPPITQAGSNSSPLSFTPTSVMRKTAADRKDSDPRVQSLVPEVKVTPQKDSNQPQNQDNRGECPPSPGRAITKNCEDNRPVTLDLGGGVRRPPLPQGPQPGLHFPQGAPPHLQHANPLLYLQKNNMAGHINPAMLNQATAMAHQQIAAVNLLAHGIDPRLARLPQPHPSMGPLSPNRTQQGPGFISPMSSQGQGSVNLARFFSPEVLAQAQSGGAPAMPPLPTQKVLTLEEIERQAAAVRI